tara:strand:- start:457 stop:615 length:159 start_codon:yes stop_codon:yes gene_type:complete
MLFSVVLFAVRVLAYGPKIAFAVTSAFTQRLLVVNFSGISHTQPHLTASLIA